MCIHVYFLVIDIDLDLLETESNPRNTLSRTSGYLTYIQKAE